MEYIVEHYSASRYKTGEEILHLLEYYSIEQKNSYEKKYVFITPYF